MIAYQGYLSQGGTPYNNPSGVPVSLILYDDANAGKQVWSQTFSGVVVANGYYSVIMDFSGNWQNGYNTFDHQYWLTANVNGQLLSPRVQFTASPYSFNAHIADSAIHIPQSPVGSIMAYGGDIFQLRNNEKKLGWYVCDGRRIPADTFPVYTQVVGAAYGVSDAGDSVYLPDFRSLFLRGVNGGMAGARTNSDSLWDPDAARRGMMRDGANQGNKVGSVQGADFLSHGHNIIDAGNKNVLSISSGYGDGPGTKCLLTLDKVGYNSNCGVYSVGVSNTGGSETRPKNAYVYWIIKVR